eukprot:scaffold502_cov115-Isochrysis_galbana.AAC.4
MCSRLANLSSTATWRGNAHMDGAESEGTHMGWGLRGPAEDKSREASIGRGRQGSARWHGALLWLIGGGGGRR